jgi:hypothetical protein
MSYSVSTNLVSNRFCLMQKFNLSVLFRSLTARNQITRLFIVFMTLNLLILPTAMAEDLDSEFYVRAARVAVRESPSINAKLVKYLPANHPIRIKSQVAGWCEAIEKPPSGSILPLGFISCQYVSNTKLRLADIERDLANNRATGLERLNALQLMFWISPSPENFLNYGAAHEIELDAREIRISIDCFSAQAILSCYIHVAIS